MTNSQDDGATIAHENGPQATAEWTETAPMTRAYVEKNDVVRRYVSGRLKQQELEAFELLFLDAPDLLDAIETEESMKRGLKQASSRLEPETTTPVWRSWLGTLVQPTSALMCAVALLSVATIQSRVQIATMTDQLYTPQLVSQSGFVFAGNRPQAEGARIELPVGVPSLLKIEVPRATSSDTADSATSSADNRRFSISIVGEQSDVYDIKDLEVDDRNMASVVFRPRAVGRYTIYVNSIKDGEAVREYPFYVTHRN